MALSFSKSNTHLSSLDVWGARKVVIVTATFDSSYGSPAGESLTPADVGLSQIDYVGVSPDAAVLPGYIVQYDYTAKTLEVYGVEQDADAADTDQLDPEDDTIDLSTLKVRLLIVGS